MNRPRALMVDDHAIVAEGIRRLLEPHADVLARFSEGKALLEAAARLQPDLVFLDIAMPDLNGIEVARRLRACAPAARVLFLTMHADGATLAEALRAGASGYLLKHSAPDELPAAVRETMAGRRYITPCIAPEVIAWSLREAARPVADERGAPRGELTSRQREVLSLVADGRSLKEIASLLGVSIKTVEFHKSRLMDIVGVRTTAELTRYALSRGLASSPGAPGSSGNRR